ncbi:MAG TPA: nucleotidyltransferase domain-containing protein [Candidatus Nanoarchaeia archaeon]|nr:nucleotidyltransferase domain-containing protein [Candidatus Nanoarchaeia archaeon]
MPSQSKEEQVLTLFLENSPLKHWHFEEIVQQAKVTRAVANKWLRLYCKEGLIKKIKELGKFPYFTSGSNNPAYLARKKIYALDKIYQSGLIDHLLALEGPKTIILFGSLARGDWYKDSDLDLFIYGSSEGLDKQKYEKRLKWEIELHQFETKEELQSVKTGLLQNVINGYLLKGDIQDFAEMKV